MSIKLIKPFLKSLIIMFISISLIIIFTPLAVIKGTLSDQMGSLKWPEGCAFIDNDHGEYAGGMTLDEMSKKYGEELQLDDDVLVICLVSPKETSPTMIKILYLLEI